MCMHALQALAAAASKAGGGGAAETGAAKRGDFKGVVHVLERKEAEAVAHHGAVGLVLALEGGHGALQCVAVCWPCVAECSLVLAVEGVRGGLDGNHTLQHTATHCNTLRHTTTHCTTLQHPATHCNTLQHTATHYNKLQHIATYPLQHTATQVCPEWQ